MKSSIGERNDDELKSMQANDMRRQVVFINGGDIESRFDNIPGRSADTVQGVLVEEIKITTLLLEECSYIKGRSRSSILPFIIRF